MAWTGIPRGYRSVEDVMKPVKHNRLQPRARATAMHVALEGIRAATGGSDANRGHWMRVLMGHTPLLGPVHPSFSRDGEKRWRIVPNAIFERCAIPVAYTKRVVTFVEKGSEQEEVFCKLLYRKDEVRAWRQQYLERIAADLTARFNAARPGSCEREVLALELVLLDREMEEVR